MIRASGLIIYRCLQEEIQYLLMQTSYGKHHWTPPKGHVDNGESDRDAALRETLEEAGLESKDLDIDWEFEKQLNYNVRSKPKCVIYWLARLKNNQTEVQLSDEHQDFKWVPLHAANQLITDYKDMQELLGEAEKYIISKK